MGNFRAVQNFVLFVDRCQPAKIKTAKSFCNVHAHGHVWERERRGERISLYRYLKPIADSPKDHSLRNLSSSAICEANWAIRRVSTRQPNIAEYEPLGTTQVYERMAF